MYYTYMIRCKDNTIYTGITTDLEKRFNEHKTKNEKCAKYTKKHTAEKIESAWTSENRVLASKLEYRIKHLTKTQKEEIIQSQEAFEKYLSKHLETQEYKKVTPANTWNKPNPTHRGWKLC